MRHVEERVHIRDIKIGDFIDSLEARVIGKEDIPAPNPHATTNVHYQLSDGRVLMMRERTAVRCRNHDVKKIISSVAVPEHIVVRREKPNNGIKDTSGSRR
jgi:hypothetical protein